MLRATHDSQKMQAPPRGFPQSHQRIYPASHLMLALAP
jgi:hypothetical protein